jgi:hypothetical protein
MSFVCSVDSRMEHKAGLQSYNYSSTPRLFVLHIPAKGCSFGHKHDAAGNKNLFTFGLHSSRRVKHRAAVRVNNKYEMRLLYCIIVLLSSWYSCIGLSRCVLVRRVPVMVMPSKYNLPHIIALLSLACSNNNIHRIDSTPEKTSLFHRNTHPHPETSNASTNLHLYSYRTHLSKIKCPDLHNQPTQPQVQQEPPPPPPPHYHALPPRSPLQPAHHPTKPANTPTYTRSLRS